MPVSAPGYREEYPFVDAVRAANPNAWLVVDKLRLDNFSEIIDGRIVADAQTFVELDAALGAMPIGEAALVGPKSLVNLHVDYFAHLLTYPAKRKHFRKLVKRISHPLVRSYLAAIAVAGGPYFRSKPASFPWAIVNRFLIRLSGVDGFESVLLRLASDNTNVVVGHFQEILRLYSVAAHRDKRPAALAKVVNVPGLGKTDIDLLTEDGLWIESKRVKGTMGLNEDFRAKLDKMGEALRMHAEIRLSTRTVRISGIHLVNLGRFSKNVRRHAESLGITVQEAAVYAFAPW